MVAVARRAGVPSGSLYHRFPSRAALLGALWLRTVRRFQAGWLAALHGDDPLVTAARHVVVWSRRNRAEALLLLHGASELAQADWPVATRRAAEQEQREAEAALRAAASLGGDRETLDRVVLAAVDIPYAALRRRLRTGEPMSHRAETLVEESARAPLG